MERGGCVYIMTNYQRSALYIGVTSDLRNRIIEHQTKFYPTSFTAKYELNICVYFEMLPTIEEAIDREKQLKKWSRTKKEFLINKLNKEWNDLAKEIMEW